MIHPLACAPVRYTPARVPDRRLCSKAKRGGLERLIKTSRDAFAFWRNQCDERWKAKQRVLKGGAAASRSNQGGTGLRHLSRISSPTRPRAGIISLMAQATRPRAIKYNRVLTAVRFKLNDLIRLGREESQDEMRLERGGSLPAAGLLRGSGC